MSLIKKPSEIEPATTIKALIYGQPGVRKTTFALSAPAPLLLDADGGVYRLDPRHQCDTLQIAKWEDVLSVLKEDLSSYKTIVVDTVGKLLDFMTTYLIRQDPKMGRRDGALTQQGYGARKILFIFFLRQVSSLGKNLIFVAHEREEKENEQKIIRPDIGGSSAGDLIKELDLVGYMQSIGDKKMISFEPCEKFYGKNSCQLAASIEIGNTLEKGLPNEQLESIIRIFQQAQIERQKTALAYADLIEDMTNQISRITGPNEANIISTWAQEYGGHIWDSKLQAALKISQKTKELGLSFDKQTKRYV